jgi:hypothetical protein
MSNRIEAPGRSALWTDAALRALTGTAFLINENGEIQRSGGAISEADARMVALDAMAIATAFEAACLAAHEAEQEARRERVRSIGRFRSPSGMLVTVERVEGDVVTFAPVDGEQGRRVAKIEHVLDEEYYEPEPAPLDAPAPTTGGEERA